MIVDDRLGLYPRLLVPLRLRLHLRLYLRPRPRHRLYLMFN